VAKDISVSPRRVNEIVHGERSITADTALRLGRYLGVSAQFWLNLQARYDLETESSRIAHKLQKEVKVFSKNRVVKVAATYRKKDDIVALRDPA